MKAAIFKGPGAVEAGERPDPVIQEPTDAIVRVAPGCVCGSDLWYYRGESQHAVGSIGHEFIGIVEQAGAGVRGVRVGDLVIAPFIYSDMSCPHCLNGSTASCVAGGNFGNGTIDGGQGEAVRVPLAGNTLVPVGLELPTRELLTFALLAALGGCDPQVRGHVAGNLNVGNGRPLLIDVITVILPFIGYPRALNALAAVNEIAPAAQEGQAWPSWPCRTESSAGPASRSARCA
jgi:alkylhydroperoxidase/carboxymuconolactone decarboxylase family protein YurZ